MNFFALLSTVATLFLLLICGFVARKIGWIDEAMSKNMSSLIIKIGQPFLIISSLIKYEFTLENLKTGLLMFVLGLGTHTVIAVIAYLCSAKIRDMDERKITEFALVFANCAFIGFPIVQAVIGDIGLFYGAFYVLSFHVFIWSWGLSILARKRSDIKLTPKKIFINLGTIPCAIGLLLYVSGLKMPEFIVDFTSYLGSLCTPISILITGSLLATRTPRQIFGSLKIYYLCAIKLIVLPVVICLIAKLLGLPEYMVIFSTIMAAMPSGSVAAIYGELYDIAPGYASQAVGTTTALSVLTLPFVMWICNLIIAL